MTVSRSSFLSYKQGAVSAAMNAALEFKKFWNAPTMRQLIANDPETAVAVAGQYATQLVQKYGGAAAANAADFYELLSGVNAAVIDTGLDEVQLVDTVGYSVQLANSNPSSVTVSKARKLITDLVSKQVKLSANRTMRASAKKNGEKYMRVPSGDTTCAFCIMLASRGAVYASEDTAGELLKYHDDCDCMILAGDTSLEGYDEKLAGYQAAYYSAKAMDGGDKNYTTEGVLRYMREDIQTNLTPSQRSAINEQQRARYQLSVMEKSTDPTTKATLETAYDAVERGEVKDTAQSIIEYINAALADDAESAVVESS